MEGSPETEAFLPAVEFGAEWQARLFAMVASLISSGVFEWSDLRAHIVRANNSVSDSPDQAGSTDLSLWAYALRNLLGERGLMR